MHRFVRTWVLRGGAATIMVAAAMTAAVAQPGEPVAEPAGAQMPPAPPAPPRGAPQLEAADVTAWLDGFMPYALARGDVAGAVVVVVKDGQVLAQKGYGYADMEKRTPVDPERTLFRPGSVSKLFTWTAVMQQVAQGKLDLDADINTYLDFKVPAKGQPITMRHVMTHTAGFEERIKGLMFTDASKMPALGPYLKSWVPKQIHPPGTAPAYSNYATALAGYVVERLSGMPFDDYVEQRIFTPLGMRHASFRQPLAQTLASGMSLGYALGSTPAKPYEYIPAAPAGSLAATGSDMAKFMLAHLQTMAGQDSPILDARTAALMYTQQHNYTPPLNAMALGFYETNFNAHRVLAHGGDTTLFHSDLRLFEHEGVGIYVSMNSSGSAGVSMPIREELFEQFTRRYLPAAEVSPEVAGVDAETAAAHARMMAAHTYLSTRRTESGHMKLLNLQQTQFTVNDDGTLSASGLDGTNGQPLRWREVSPFVWQQVEGTQRLAAVERDGRIALWSVDAFAPAMAFQPAPASLSSAWLLPALGMSLLVLAISALWWPAAALARRRHRITLPWPRHSLRAYRGSRAAAAVLTAGMLGWFGLLAYVMSDFTRLGSAMDKWVLLLAGIGWLACTLGIAAMAWNLVRAWRDGRGLWAVLWSALMLLAALVVLYVSLRFGLLSFALEY